MTTKLTGRPSLAYKGVEAAQPPNFIYKDTPPSLADQAWVRPGYFDMEIGDLWLKRDPNDGTPYELWMLADKSFATGERLARWILLYPQAGGGGGAITFTTDMGDAVTVGNVLLVPGGTGIETSGAANVLTISVDGTVATTFTADDGNSATPAGNNLNITGGALIATSVLVPGSDTFQIDMAEGLNGQIPIAATGAPTIFATPISSDATITITPGVNSLDFIISEDYLAEVTGDVGFAVVDATNNLNILGGELINTEGDTVSTLTINLDRGDTKQIIVGETGQPADYYDLISSDASVLIVQDTGAKTLDFTAVGGGGGAVNSVTAGTNINLTGTAANPIVNLNSSIQQPATNAAGTQGVYSLGATALPGGYITDRFMHGYGTSNAFLGLQSGNMTTTGTNSVGIGADSLQSIVSGTRNTALGSGSGIGLLTGSDNFLGGYLSGFNYTGGESDNILLMHQGVAAESGRIRIGTTGTQTNTFIAGIWQNVPANPFEIVRIDANGTLGSFTGNTGQVLSGVTGASPAWKTLTPGAGINIINTATVITIEATGAGAVASVTAGDNINLTGTAANPIVNLDTSVIQPVFGSAVTPGSEGVYAVGATDYQTDRMLYNRGTHSLFVGYQAGNFTFTTGAAVDNTGLGYKTLNALTTGATNTAAGAHAGESITYSSSNSLYGYFSGQSLGGGTGKNVMMGYRSGQLIETGSYNTLIGSDSGRNLGISSTSNTFVGYNAGVNIGNRDEYLIIGSLAASTMNPVTSNPSLVIGTNAGMNASDIQYSVIVGNDAFPNSVNTASESIMIGSRVGRHITTSSEDVIIGNLALETMTGSSAQNIVIGGDTDMGNGGSSNIIIGHNAGNTSAGTVDNNIYIGVSNANVESNKIRIGNNVTGTYIDGINNNSITTNRELVVVDKTTGQLGYDANPFPFASFDYYLPTDKNNVTGDNTLYTLGSDSGSFTAYFDTTTPGDIDPGGPGLTDYFTFTPSTLGMYIIVYTVTFNGITVPAPAPPPAATCPIYIYYYLASTALYRIYTYYTLPITYISEIQTFQYIAQIPFTAAGDYIQFAVQVPQLGGAKTMGLLSTNKSTFIQGTYISPVA